MIMQVYQYRTKIDEYSIPFDWDKNRMNYKYVKQVVDTYFHINERVGFNWNPTFFGVVNKKQKIADLGSIVSDRAIVMSQKAVSYLEPLLSNSELLSYPTEIGDYYLVNVLNEGPYLDRQNSNYDRLLSNGLCAGINEYKFHPDTVQNQHIFFIPDAPLTCFISGKFIETCKQHNLQGIYLTDSVKVWDSEQQ